MIGFAKSSPDEHGQHASHCCVKHKCKYGDENCPVACRKVKQTGPCEECPEGSSGQYAEVTISRTTHAGRGDLYEDITIRIGGGKNKIVEITLSLEEFALVLTGRGGVLGAIRETVTRVKPK